MGVTLQRRLATLVVLAGTMASVLGCSAQDSVDSTENPQTGSPEATTLGHVHGLGVDPADGTLYVASHFGVFRVKETGEPERVAHRWQDTMGFAVVGPGRFLGSGHPDLREDLPTSLGLIESTDGAKTWTSVSLQGEADFHSLEPVGGRIYAYDSRSGSLIVSTDRKKWDTIAIQPLLDLAADPADPDTVYATTDEGALVRSVDNAELVPVAGAPTLTAIDWQPNGPLVGVAPDGTVMVSTAGQSDWQKSGSLDGPVEALDASPGRWHAATDTGVYESTDDGATWNHVLGQHG